MPSLGIPEESHSLIRPSDPFKRNRPLYASAAVVVMMTGLLWRTPVFHLPGSVSKYGGDALWALLVFIGCGFLFNASSTRRLATLSLCFAWCIEFFQLYHAPWIDSIRSTTVGHLVLGSTFNAPDLLAYAAGITLGAWADYTYRHLIRPVSCVPLHICTPTTHRIAKQIINHSQ